jgi:cytochrome bd-type quinol oxidase subunit 1
MSRELAHTVAQILTLAIVYAALSAFTLYRRASEPTRAEGWRRWRKMSLLLAFGLVVAVLGEAIKSAAQHSKISN